jgi:hypothetical protein
MPYLHRFRHVATWGRKKDAAADFVECGFSREEIAKYVIISGHNFALENENATKDPWSFKRLSSISAKRKTQRANSKKNRNRFFKQNRHGRTRTH